MCNFFLYNVMLCCVFQAKWGARVAASTIFHAETYSSDPPVVNAMLTQECMGVKDVISLCRDALDSGVFLKLCSFSTP